MLPRSLTYKHTLKWHSGEKPVSPGGDEQMWNVDPMLCFISDVFPFSVSYSLCLFSCMHCWDYTPFSTVVKTWTKREINRKKSMREKARERESSLHQIYPSFPSFSAVPAQILHCWQLKSRRRGLVVCVFSVHLLPHNNENVCPYVLCMCERKFFFLTDDYIWVQGQHVCTLAPCYNGSLYLRAVYA